jgi:hypothetical protein
VTPVSSSDDAFRHFREKRGVDGDGDMDAIALFSYALVELDRIDWIDHFKNSRDGHAPSAEQTREWFEAKPESYFREKEDRAETWYAGFARWYLRDEIEEGKSEAIRLSIGNLAKFWPSFWSGNLIGITSNIVFTALVVLFVAAITTDFSFIAWAKALFTGHH